jgi:hypothetical protein
MPRNIITNMIRCYGRAVIGSVGRKASQASRRWRCFTNALCGSAPAHDWLWPKAEAQVRQPGRPVTGVNPSRSANSLPGYRHPRDVASGAEGAALARRGRPLGG